MAVWTTPKNLREFPFVSVGSSLQRLWDISNFALVVWPSSIQHDLSPEDIEVKRKLVKHGLRAYSELIRLDILGPSGSKSSRPPSLRPSPASGMQPSDSCHSRCFGINKIYILKVLLP